MQDNDIIQEIREIRRMVEELYQALMLEKISSTRVYELKELARKKAINIKQKLNRKKDGNKTL